MGSRRLVCGIIVGATLVFSAFAERQLAAESAQSDGAGATESTQPTLKVAESWDEAYDQGNWPEAIRLGRILCEREPGNPAFFYNLACTFVRKGDLETGMTTLIEAVELGFDNPMLLISDSDLSPLRSDPRFDSLAATAQENRERGNAEFRALADEREPLIWTPPGHDPRSPAPVIIALHPYGSRAEWIFEYWRNVAEKEGAIVLCPRAVRASGDGFQWGTIEETQYVVSRSFELLKEQYTLDETRILLTGFSQGAYMAFNLGRLHGNVVTSVLPIAGQYERELADPELVPKDRQARFYLLIGTEDSVYPSNILAMEDLRRAGFRIRIRPIRGLGHSFPADHETELETALDFLWN